MPRKPAWGGEDVHRLGPPLLVLPAAVHQRQVRHPAGAFPVVELAPGMRADAVPPSLQAIQDDLLAGGLNEQELTEITEECSSLFPQTGRPHRNGHQRAQKTRKTVADVRGRSSPGLLCFFVFFVAISYLLHNPGFHFELFINFNVLRLTEGVSRLILPGANLG